MVAVGRLADCAAIEDLIDMTHTITNHYELITKDEWYTGVAIIDHFAPSNATALSKHHQMFVPGKEIRKPLDG